MEVIKRVNELTQKLRVVEGLDELSKEAQNNATLMFFSLLRCMLASRRVLEEHKLTDRSFNWLLGEVETRFNQVSAPTVQHSTGRRLSNDASSLLCYLMQTLCKFHAVTAATACCSVQHAHPFLVVS